MFEKSNMRLKISLVWIFVFIGLWTIFQYSFPMGTMLNQLDSIEQSIENKDWDQAKYFTTQFTDTFKAKRYLIQVNNSTEAFITFEHTVGQLRTTVKHKEDSALEYVGALRELVNLVVKPFAGP